MVALLTHGTPLAGAAQKEIVEAVTGTITVVVKTVAVVLMGEGAKRTPCEKAGTAQRNSAKMLATMNRRNFLGSLIGSVAAGAAVRTWPFRIFSFPQEVVLRAARSTDFLCDFVNGTAVREELELQNGVWVPQSRTTIKVGKVDWQRNALKVDREVFIVKG